MKFFHLSDLHIGKHLFYYSLLEDQKYVFHQILEAAKEEQPDAVLLCGDIYDKTIPSAEAVSLFDWFLTELKEIKAGFNSCFIVKRNIAKGTDPYHCGKP